MVSTVAPIILQNQGSVLRISGNIEAPIESIYEYLRELEVAYNSVYVLKSIIEEGKEIFDLDERQKPLIPLKSLLWMTWWPPTADKVKSLVSQNDRLKIYRAEFHSPGFWDFLGKLNPLETIREYLNDRHERQKDRNYRNQAEKDKLEIENIAAKIKLYIDAYDGLSVRGVKEQDICVLRDKLLIEPLKKLDKYQDQKIITTADFVDVDYK